MNLDDYQINILKSHFDETKFNREKFFIKKKFGRGSAKKDLGLTIILSSYGIYSFNGYSEDERRIDYETLFCSREYIETVTDYCLDNYYSKQQRTKGLRIKIKEKIMQKIIKYLSEEDLMSVINISNSIIL